MNSFTELQSIVMQMENRITDDLCATLLNEVSNLEKSLQSRPGLLAPVKMLGATATYLKTNLDRAHPDTWSVLKTTADKLEALAAQDQVEKKDVQPLIDHYRHFQNKLASRPDVDPLELENLKASILAVDWEISDRNIQNFQAELAKQMEKFKDYNVQYTLLKMIQSTGKYIALNKVNAHSESLVFIKSVYETLEETIQTPDITFAQKKELLKQSIKKFQNFKDIITNRTAAAEEPLPREPEPAEKTHEEPVPDMTPALSHLKQGSPAAESADDISPLTVLDDDGSPESFQGETISPALSGKAEPNGEPMDIMDDLFSIKESPADELLDAIHLLDVHGSGPDKALSMLDATSGETSEDAKSFTPKRASSEPIKEIDKVLDDFFNLGPPSPQPQDQLEAQIIQEQLQGDDTGDASDFDESTDDDLTALEHEPDEDVPEMPPLPESEAIPVSTGEIISWLKSELKMIQKNQAGVDSAAFEEKLELLRNQLAEDNEKKELVEIVASALSIIQMHIPEKEREVDTLPEQAEPAAPKRKGLIARIKGIFSSSR